MREHGAILQNEIQMGTTMRCPHCGGHFIVAASGSLAQAQKTLGQLARPKVTCRKCGRLTCGRPGCDPSVACIPLEARLEYVEGKTDSRYRESIEDHIGRGQTIL